MAKKGQTCLNCDATCCRIHIEYHGSKDTFSDGCMNHSRRELIENGCREVFPGTILSLRPCTQLTDDGLCSLQNDKPRLCRSFWCGGKLWKPKGTVADLKARSHRGHKITIIPHEIYPEYQYTWCQDCGVYLDYWKTEIKQGGNDGTQDV